MHTYDETEAYCSVTRTFSDLNRWSLTALLSEHAALAVQLRDAQAAQIDDDDPLVLEVARDVAKVAIEVERRTVGVATTDAAALTAEVDQ